MKNKVLQQLWKIVCKVRVLFATVAFWMGVYILHIHQIFCPLVPWSIEGYYQKISRAGQDGRKAIARLFFNGSKQAIRMIQEMSAYCHCCSKCLRQYLMNYFDNSLVSKTVAHIVQIIFLF